MNKNIKIQTIQDEVVAHLQSKDCCSLAFLSAYLRSNLVVNFAQMSTIKFRGYNAFLSHYIISKIKAFATKIELNFTYTIKQLQKSCQILVIGSKQDIKEFLLYISILIKNEDGLVEISNNINGLLLIDDCCKLEYLKGIFLANATLSRSSNHLSFAFRDKSFCDDVAVLLQLQKIPTKYTFMSSATDTKQHFLYIYGLQNIADMLALMGASKSTLLLYNDITINEQKKQANRSLNCTIANIDKSINYCIQTVQYCQKIVDQNATHLLTKTLQQTLQTRLFNPQDPLQSLAVILGVSKSCVKNRLEKIKEVSNNI